VCPQLLIQSAHKFDEIDIQGRQPRPQLDDVQPTLAPLYFADRGLIATETTRHISLPELDGLSVATQQLEEDLVVTTVQGLEHGDLRAQPYRRHRLIPKPTVGVPRLSITRSLHLATPRQP
jgi:hypothetical protein